MLFDYSKSGMINARDIGPVVRSVGLKPSQAEIRSIMADVQQSGMLNVVPLLTEPDTYLAALKTHGALCHVIVSVAKLGFVCCYFILMAH